MSYDIENKYKILPRKSYEIIRNCPKCGCKTNYINTNNFRVNANGKALDVWLIYQCEKCRHTYNLTIDERVKMSCINKQEYDKFIRNDFNLAFEYGTRKEIFLRNNAVIDEDKIIYDILFKDKLGKCVSDKEMIMIIDNPYELKIRVDKVLSEIINVSRNKVKDMIKKKVIRSKEYNNLEKSHVGKLMKIELSTIV